MKSQRLNPTSWLLSLALLATIGLAGCSFAATNTNQPAANTNQQPSDNANEAAMKKEVTVTLTEQNSSGQSGTATITDQNGKAKGTIAIYSASWRSTSTNQRLKSAPTSPAVTLPATVRHKIRTPTPMQPTRMATRMATRTATPTATARWGATKTR